MSAELVPVDDTSLTADLSTAVEVTEAWLPQLEGDTFSLAYGIRNLDRLIAGLRSIRRTACEMTYRSLPERTVESTGKVYKKKLAVDGLGSVEPVHAQREWTDPEYVRAFQACIRVAMDRGEINHPNDVADLVVEIVSLGSFKCDAKKGTGLAKYGFTKDKFATEKLGDPSVRIL